ncbi:hypothetical protein SDC9_210312 [bioreactor metagenome]|uniref:Uncharacterized protein n=1 Tax=bioreactor metagenome TaxID=1076179 RepID=A0A645JTD2_9ZZZZ
MQIRLLLKSLNDLLPVFLLFRFNQFDGFVELYLQRVDTLRQGNKFIVMTGIGTKAAYPNHHIFPPEFTERTRQFEQFQCLFEGDGFKGL